MSEIEIPESWLITSVNDVASSIQYGYTESSSKVEVGPRFLRITDIQDNKVSWTDVPYCRIKDDDKVKYLLESGDLVFARTGATVGKSFLIRGIIPESVFASYLIRVRFFKVLQSSFAWYYFQSPMYWVQILDKSVGTGQPNVNGTKLGELLIPLPPLAEQQRIVAKIEELFSELDKGVETLRTAQEQLKVYRQAVLKYAFEGRLTNPDVKEGELPLGWISKSIGEVVTKSTLKSYPDSSSDALFLGMDSIEPNSTKPHHFYKFSEMKSAGNVFTTNQVLYGRMRPYLNKVWVANFDGVASGEFIVMNCTTEILPHYLLHILHHQDFVTFANSKTSGDRPRISFDEIAEFQIHLPKVKEQALLLSEIESRLSVCDKIEESIEQGLQQAEALRQSILKKAFEGNLVPQDPNDEPASVLLERIEVERAKTQLNKKSKNKKTTV